MSKRLFGLMLPFLAVFVLGAATPALADDDGVVRFATLPKPGPGFPEGIAADAAGRIYVATFDFSQPNVIYIFDRNGKVDATISLPAGAVPLGMEFDAQGRLYVANFSQGNVLRYSPPFNSGSLPDRTFAVCGGAGAGCGLNSLTFDAAGDLYVSDSFGGNVFRIDLPGGAVSTYLVDDLLRPGNHGFPPYPPKPFLEFLFRERRRCNEFKIRLEVGKEGFHAAAGRRDDRHGEEFLACRWHPRCRPLWCGCPTWLCT